MSIFEIFILQPIFNLLLGIYSVVGDFGISVIVFTLIVRFAMWPLVVRQMQQTKAMRKIQPELVRIKEKSKGNKQLEGMQMLELYKKHGIKPFRTILVLLIQLPIFIALFRVIQIFTSHRDQIESFTYGFMNSFEPIRRLVENPDTFNQYFLGIVDITSTAVTESGIDIFLLVIAVLAAVTQYLISKQTNPSGKSKRLRDVLAEASEGKEPDQAELNAVVMGKMVKILPIMMFFIMFSLPGAIGVYYVTSNLFVVIQQHFLLKRNTEELEDLAIEALKKETGKKATAKARAKQAREAEKVNEVKVTRIKAKDSPRSKERS